MGGFSKIDFGKNVVIGLAGFSNNFFPIRYQQTILEFFPTPLRALYDPISRGEKIYFQYAWSLKKCGDHIEAKGNKEIFIIYHYLKMFLPIEKWIILHLKYKMLRPLLH